MAGRRPTRARRRAEIVVNAAGYRAGEIMALVGRHLPIVAMSHQYLVTEDIPALGERGSEKLPLLRDPDVSLLSAPGAARPDPRAPTRARRGRLAGRHPGRLRQPALARRSRAARVLHRGRHAPACRSWPRRRQARHQRPDPLFAGRQPLYRPGARADQLLPVLLLLASASPSPAGPASSWREWVVDGAPEWDIWVFDPRRYTDYATATYTAAKAIELYQHEYAIAFPFEERPGGRPARTHAALRPACQAKGARFGARGGWERAVWFARRSDRRADPAPSFRRPATGTTAVKPRSGPCASASGVHRPGRLHQAHRSRARAPRPCSTGCSAARLPRLGRVGARLRAGRARAASSASSRSPGWPRSASTSCCAGGARNGTTMDCCAPPCRRDGSVHGWRTSPPGWGTLVAGGAGARARCCSRSPRPICPTPPFPGCPRARSRSASAAPWRCASTMSASSAGSCTCRLEQLLPVYEALMAAGRRPRHPRFRHLRHR